MGLQRSKGLASKLLRRACDLRKHIQSWPADPLASLQLPALCPPTAL